MRKPISTKEHNYQRALLETLRVLNKGWVSLRELGIRLGSPMHANKPLTKAATYARLAKLRELGYDLKDKYVMSSSGHVIRVFHCADTNTEKIGGGHD